MRQGRNYLILIVIYVFTILGVFYFSRVYSNSFGYSSFDLGSYDITGSYDAMYSNIYNYSSENDEFVILVSDVDSYSDNYLFINADKVSFNDLNKLIVAFGGSSVDFRVPLFISFKNGRIVNVSFEVIE